jgi:hypothetical protein
MFTTLIGNTKCKIDKFCGSLNGSKEILVKEMHKHNEMKGFNNISTGSTFKDFTQTLS